MPNTASLAVAIVALAVTAGAQNKKVTVADFTGTWSIEVMSHQLALVIEAGEGNTATATMMAMGRDTLLKGELVDRTMTFVGTKAETNSHVPGGHLPHAVRQSDGKPFTVTLMDDGTITGEMMTMGGPVKWTGEKLRARKKG